MTKNSLILALFLALVITGCAISEEDISNEKFIKDLVYKHAKSWETGDYELLDSLLHENVLFAYPGRRLNKTETLNDLIDYNNSFKDTKIYINKIIVNGNDVAVEWQFASTNKNTGNRTAVSDAIIGRVQDGKFIVWKEYLDGRVSRMQIAGNLSIDEGEEPFPWPRKK